LGAVLAALPPPLLLLRLPPPPLLLAGGAGGVAAVAAAAARGGVAAAGADAGAGAEEGTTAAFAGVPVAVAVAAAAVDELLLLLLLLLLLPAAGDAASAGAGCVLRAEPMARAIFSSSVRPDMRSSCCSRAPGSVLFLDGTQFVKWRATHSFPGGRRVHPCLLKAEGAGAGALERALHVGAVSRLPRRRGRAAKRAKQLSNTQRS
jgi:hypothetical protein